LFQGVHLNCLVSNNFDVYTLVNRRDLVIDDFHYLFGVLAEVQVLNRAGINVPVAQFLTLINTFADHLEEEVESDFALTGTLCVLVDPQLHDFEVVHVYLLFRVQNLNAGLLVTRLEEGLVEEFDRAVTVNQALLFLLGLLGKLVLQVVLVQIKLFFHFVFVFIRDRHRTLKQTYGVVCKVVKVAGVSYIVIIGSVNPILSSVRL